MNVLYETRLLNPKGEIRVYVGIHSLKRGPLWSKEFEDGYIGSGGMFNISSKKCGYVKYLKPGWIVLSVTVLKENATLDDETELIKDYQTRFGIVPECKNLVASRFSLGICINVSEGSANLQSTSLRKKAVDARTKYYQTEKGRNDLRERSRRNTSEKRSESMKRNPEWVNKFVTAGHSEESRKKRHETYVNSGNAKRISDLGNVAIMAKGRKCILNDGFIGICSEIERHTGLKKGSVGAKMSAAYKYGESSCLGWTFKPYIGNDTNRK